MKADPHTLSAAFKLGAEIAPHPRYDDVEVVRFGRHIIAVSIAGGAFLCGPQ